jgi:hypothetical protein
MSKDTLVLNLLGGPGTGKSSTRAGVFSNLKWRNINCEEAPEFAKEKVWEGSLNILNNQIYVFGKQLHALHRIDGQVDVAITDSPLLLSLIYGTHESPEFKALVLEVFGRFNNFNIFLNRKKPYNPKGRLQTEDQARGLDLKIRDLLDSNDIPFMELDAGPDSVPFIADLIADHISAGKGEDK